jgi:hypothetical protein
MIRRRAVAPGYFEHFPLHAQLTAPITAASAPAPAEVATAMMAKRVAVATPPIATNVVPKPTVPTAQQNDALIYFGIRCMCW